MARLHQPAHHLVQRPLVGHVELLGVVGAVLLGVAAHGRAARAADLADAHLQEARAHLLALPGGNDHARVGHGQADAGRDFGEGLVVDAVVERVRVDVVGALHARYADGVRADAVHGLQVLRVHDQPRELILVQFQPEQHAQAHVVDAALHGAVHGLGVPGVVVLGTGGVQALVALPVIGLLEQDVGADARVLELSVVLHRRGGDVHVHAADVAVLVVDGVNGIDALQDVLDGVVHRVLAGLDGQALVAHVLQRDDLRAHLVLRQLPAGDVLVLQVIGAVQAAVDAVVRQVQRREHHDAVAIEGQLDLLGDLVHLLDLFRDLAGQQHRGLPVRQPRAGAAVSLLHGARLFKDLVDQRHIVLVRLGVFQRRPNLFVVDEFLSP